MLTARISFHLSVLGGEGGGGDQMEHMLPRAFRINRFFFLGGGHRCAVVGCKPEANGNANDRNPLHLLAHALCQNRAFRSK